MCDGRWERVDDTPYYLKISRYILLVITFGLFVIYYSLEDTHPFLSQYFKYMCWAVGITMYLTIPFGDYRYIWNTRRNNRQIVPQNTQTNHDFVAIPIHQPN